MFTLLKKKKHANTLDLKIHFMLKLLENNKSILSEGTTYVAFPLARISSNWLDNVKRHKPYAEA